MAYALSHHKNKVLRYGLAKRLNNAAPCLLVFEGPLKHLHGVSG